MTSEEARELIFHRLCQEYKKHGEAWVKREPLADELKIPQDLFGKVLDGLRNKRKCWNNAVKDAQENLLAAVEKALKAEL